MIPTLTYPWALVLLLGLPWLAWRHWRRSSGAWQYSDRLLLPAHLGARVRWARWGGLVLRVAGVFLAILALSGPRWPDPSSRIPSEGISIAMVLDVSQSMGNDDFVWEEARTSRLAGVKKLFRLFVAGGEAPGQVSLAGRPQDLIALVAFATHPDTACPLTLDHATLLKIMDAQEPRISAEEGTTNPGDALAWALHVLQQAPTRRKVVVFLTDGESNVLDRLTPLQSAHLAKNLAIPIYAIDAAPEPSRQASKEEIAKAAKARADMEALANMTDGQCFRAQDAGGLTRAYESIDLLERDRILSFQYRRHYEGFIWFAFASLICWLTMLVLESTIWRRFP